jgi:hypothetical protein
MSSEEIPDTGLLPEPQFIRYDPGQLPRWRPRPKTFPWTRHFELCRNNPLQWALIAEYKKGGCRARQAVLDKDRRRMNQWLKRNFPLERWEIKQVTLAGTHCDRQLFIRYLGFLTPEEDAIDRERRREIYWARRERARERKAVQAIQARRDAEKAQAEAKKKIRDRRRPGQ